MTCYHPLKRFDTGLINPDTGKSIGKVRSFEVDHLLQYHDDYGDLAYQSFTNSICVHAGTCGNKICSPSCYEVDPAKAPPFGKVLTDYLIIPCGQCIGCRIELSKQWANRMVMELPYSVSSWFITLTYDDDHVPPSGYVDSDGVWHDSLTLRRRDFDLFMKRLRRRFPGYNIRFYGCGEYGSETFRPHYHAILFNCPLDKDGLELYQRSPKGDSYYLSPILSSAWSEPRPARSKDPYVPLGRALCSKVNWSTCAYVARYVVKKLTGTMTDYYKYFGLEKEFATMSRNPGLGRQWYEEHKSPEELITYIIRISDGENPLKFSPPEYFKRLYEYDFPETLADVKETNRKVAQDRTALKLAHTDLSYLEMLEVEERNFKKRISSLKRGDVHEQEEG